MDLKVESSSIASVEDNISITNVPNSQPTGNLDEPTDNGSCSVEDNCDDELFSELNGNGTKVFDSGILPPEIKDGVSPSSSMTRKGFGLKKWKRIRRDLNKSGDTSGGVGNMPVEGELSPAVHLSKKLQNSSERKQKSEGSISSTNAVERGLDGFNLLGGSELVMGPLFAAGTDSENSEDHSSKSSTAASAPKINYGTQGIKGFSHDKSSLWSLSGKNLTNSVQRGLQVKSQVETSKKARGEPVEIEKENSQSSLESDSRNSNFVFMQGTYSASNGIQSGRPTESDGQNDDEVQGSERKFKDKLQGGSSIDCERGYKGISFNDVAVDSSWELKEEGSKNQGSSSDQDDLVESIIALQSVQEALEKEVLKFREIIKDVSLDGSVQDLPLGFEDISQKLNETRSEQLQAEVIETTDRNVETELENLFKQKLEAEIEYFVMSRMVQNLRVDQSSVLEDRKALVSVKIRNKAKILKKDTKKFENFWEDIASADERSELKTSICKYTTCFFFQLVLLMVLLVIIMLQLSTNYMEAVPT